MRQGKAGQGEELVKLTVLGAQCRKQLLKHLQRAVAEAFGTEMSNVHFGIVPLQCKLPRLLLPVNSTLHKLPV